MGETVTSCCQQCGATLEQLDAFCTKCGAQRSVVPQASGPRRFCTKCGTPLNNSKFCTKCGMPVDLPSETLTTSPVPPATSISGTKVSSATNASSSAAPAAEPSRTPVVHSSGFPKVVIVAIGVAAALILAIVAGGIYGLNRVRHKADQNEAKSEIERSLAEWRTASASALNQPATTGSSVGQDSKNPPALNATRNLDINDPAVKAKVANVIVQNLDKPPGEFPQSTLPLGITVSSPAPGSYTWKQGEWTYTWNSQGLRDDYRTRSYPDSHCPLPHPLSELSPLEPQNATGNQSHDWSLKYERTVGGPEADLVVRTGDINNLGFGWPQGFDPFSGQSTPAHHYPWKPPADEPAGTDRIMVASIVTDLDFSHRSDGYSKVIYSCSCPSNFPPCQGRFDTMPQPVMLAVGELPPNIGSVLFQIFADDFQAPVLNSHFQVSLNGTRIPTFEDTINALQQTGPIGKLVTLQLLPEYWPLLKSGTVKLFIDDPTTHVPDGYAIDFVRILVNPHQLKYQVSLNATVTDADKHTPIAGATVSAAPESAATDRSGKCELKGIPAGLVVAAATAPGYDENSVTVDLAAGQAGHADIQLHAHEESTAALEQSIAQTGTATIYGIHFDTDSSKLRPDSLPALNAVLGLINNHPGSRWMIAGHTDNQGAASHNQTLSEARASSVVTWLTAHAVAASQLAPQGFGASRPVADNATANGRALNRRVEVSLAK